MKLYKLLYARGSNTQAGFHWIYIPQWTQIRRSVDLLALNNFCQQIADDPRGLQGNDQGTSAFFFFKGEEGAYLFRCFLHYEGGRGALSLEGMASQDCLALFKEVPSIISSLYGQPSELGSMPPATRDIFSPVVQEVESSSFDKFYKKTGGGRRQWSLEDLSDDIRNSGTPFDFVAGIALPIFDVETRVYGKTSPPHIPAPALAPVVPLKLADHIKVLLNGDPRWDGKDVGKSIKLLLDYLITYGSPCDDRSAETQMGENFHVDATLRGGLIPRDREIGETSPLPDFREIDQRFYEVSADVLPCGQNQLSRPQTKEPVSTTPYESPRGDGLKSQKDASSYRWKLRFFPR
jgi:hypothetical protein